MRAFAIPLLAIGLVPSIFAGRSEGDLAARARTALIQVMTRDRSSAMLHASDALITFGQGDRVHEVFRRGLPELEGTPRRLGVWRELALTSPSAAERADWTGKIVKALLEPDGRNRTSGFENLCKMGYPYAGPTLAVARRAANGSLAADKPFAWWALQQAGDPTAVQHLAALLDSADPRQRVLAVYALRWIHPADPAVIQKVAAVTDRESADTIAYAYLLSAALILDPSAPEAGVWRSKMEQVLFHGHGIDRYQACHALLPFYRKTDLRRLSLLLSDPDPDGRVAGAWIILHVLAQPA